MAIARLIREQLSANHRIAVAAVEVLAESGEATLRARAIRALGDEAPAIHQVGRWISPKRLVAMLEAAALGRNRARRVGQKLVKPSGVGVALCYSGLATPEKAYRRIDDLLARETGAGRYAAASIGDHCARITFDPVASGVDPRDAWPAELGSAVCGMREGMLEAIPMLFGLLPARVRETQCAYAGSLHCEFEVKWSHMPRRGLFLGAGLGVALGAAALGAGGIAGWGLALGALFVALLGAGAGRAFDLAQQLEAVGGARRGQLALLEQLESGLAERLDDIARSGVWPVSAGNDLSAGEGLVPIFEASRMAGAAGIAMAQAVGEAVSQAEQAAATLGSDLDRMREQLAERSDFSAEWTDLVARCAAHGRQIEEAASILGRAVGGCGGRRGHDPRKLVERALASFRAGQPEDFAIEVELAEDLPEISCNAEQIALVIERLLVNAASASAGEEQATVRLTLLPASGGIEVRVEDEGECLEADAIDRIFDPFEEDAPDPEGPGQGLPACLRIVEDHGGEFVVQPVNDRGNCISFVLPAQARD